MGSGEAMACLSAIGIVVTVILGLVAEWNSDEPDAW